MKGPGAAQPRNNAPFHSLSDTYTWSYMNDPPRLPQDLIWSASPLSPASAPTDVFIIALSRLCRRCRRAGRGARRHLAGKSRGSPAPRRGTPRAGHGDRGDARAPPPSPGVPKEVEVLRGEAAGRGGRDPGSRWATGTAARRRRRTHRASHPEGLPSEGSGPPQPPAPSGGTDGQTARRDQSPVPSWGPLRRGRPRALHPCAPPARAPARGDAGALPQEGDTLTSSARGVAVGNVHGAPPRPLRSVQLDGRRTNASHGTHRNLNVARPSGSKAAPAGSRLAPRAADTSRGPTKPEKSNRNPSQRRPQHLGSQRGEER